jgi:hypothetical protein
MVSAMATKTVAPAPMNAVVPQGFHAKTMPVSPWTTAEMAFVKREKTATVASKIVPVKEAWCA